MNITQYSTVVSILILLLALATIISTLACVYSLKARAWMFGFSYEFYVRLIALIALISTAGVLIYQFVYDTPVCDLCWWQRIFMFPIEIVVLVCLYYRVRVSHAIAAVLASIGVLIAGYHYFTHLQKYVLISQSTLPLPCAVTGELVADCSRSPILTFGFITIPFMAVIAFLAILWLVFLAHQKGERKKNF